MNGSAIHKWTSFIGEWKTEGTLLPDMKISGTDTYQWLPGRHFILHTADVMMGKDRSQTHEIISADEAGNFTMSFYNSHGEHGNLKAIAGENGKWTFEGTELQFSGGFSADGNTMSGTWQRLQDGQWTDVIEIKLNKASNIQTLRIELLKETGTTFGHLRGAIAAFSNAQFNTIPFEGSWTAGQVAEHLEIASGGIPDAETKASNRAFDKYIPAIKEMFDNDEQKYKADTFLQPKQDTHDNQQLLNVFREHEARLMEITNTSDLEALCLDMEIPGFGHLTRYEWLVFILAHTQRHTRQLERIYAVLAAV